jgi:hypothetical protein
MSIKGLYPSNEGPRIHENTCQASAQNTIAHKPAITIRAPPQRASEDRRSSEKAGAAAASAFTLSRATLMSIPCAGSTALEGYNVDLVDWQGAAPGSMPQAEL